MFDLDRWREIFEAISKNKLRTFLTGFTVAFAILLFTLLFGVGKGLQNTFIKQFSRNADNVVYVFTGKTSKAYKGFQTGREVQLKNSDYDFIRKNFSKKVQYITSSVSKFLRATNEGEVSMYRTLGVHPDNIFIDNNTILYGRYIKKSDLNRRAKVAVIGNMVAKDLYKNRSALNKLINIDGINYKVIGVFSDEGGDNEERVIYVPISTMQGLYGNNDEINEIKFTYAPTLSIDEALKFGKNVQQELRKKNNVHPRDRSGIRIFNMAEANKDINVLMFGLNLVIFIIAFGTLIAGMIGVSNIMVFIVKERTRELGVRKAMGATPGSIIGMILQETIFITIIAGYSGLVLGMGIINWMRPKLEDYFIKDASVSTGSIIVATILLIISGLLAGYFPAKKAARIKPIDALNA